MDPHYRTMIEFLRGLGTEDVTHSGEKGFLAHLVSVFHNLERWGCDRDLCRAGLFHSIYGTELFQRFCVCISVTGWSRSLAPSAGATDESRTIKWRSGWAGLHKTRFIACLRWRHWRRVTQMPGREGLHL